MLISVIAALKSAGQDVIGLVVGNTVTEADCEFKKGLERQIQQSNIGKQIVWMGFRTDIGDILAATDCVLIPSEEGLSLVAMEAMAAKCRVVAIASGGAFELLNGIGCGTFYGKENVTDATDAVRNVLRIKNPEECYRGYQFCLKQTYENFHKNLENYFMESETY